MAEIKFTTERMKQVHNRIDEMTSQLQSSINSVNTILERISSNIQSDNIQGTLKTYTLSTQEELNKTITNLKALDEYLLRKIGAYGSIDEAGISALNEVQSMLDQLGS